MAYDIRIKQSALKALKKVDQKARARIWTTISGLADDPRPRGCVKLSNADDLWRLRIGDYRIVYHIREKQLVIVVVKIGHRRDVYK